MGKKVEQALLGYTVAQAQAAGADRIKAPPVDGPRNGPAKEFFAARFSNSDVAVIDQAYAEIPPQISLKEQG